MNFSVSLTEPMFSLLLKTIPPVLSPSINSVEPPPISRIRTWPSSFRSAVTP